MKLHGVVRVVPYQNSSFFQTRTGWYAIGDNDDGQLGLGHCNNVSTPTRIESRWDLVDRFADSRSSFFTTTDPATPLVACGLTNCGLLGVSSPDHSILTPVTLPAGLDVTRVMIDNQSTFIFSGTRCFVCGDNSNHSIGLPTNEEFVRVPTELTFPVSAIIKDYYSTVFISEGRLLAIGYQQRTHSRSPIASPFPPRSITLGR